MNRLAKGALLRAGSCLLASLLATLGTARADLGTCPNPAWVADELERLGVPASFASVQIMTQRDGGWHARVRSGNGIRHLSGQRCGEVQRAATLAAAGLFLQTQQAADATTTESLPPLSAPEEPRESPQERLDESPRAETDEQTPSVGAARPRPSRAARSVDTGIRARIGFDFSGPDFPRWSFGGTLGIEAWINRWRFGTSAHVVLPRDSGGQAAGNSRIRWRRWSVAARACFRITRLIDGCPVTEGGQTIARAVADGDSRSSRTAWWSSGAGVQANLALSDRIVGLLRVEVLRPHLARTYTVSGASEVPVETPKIIARLSLEVAWGTRSKIP